MFAGREVARALAVMSLKEEDCTDDLQGVSDKQMGVLQDWEEKFKIKYEVVGKVSLTGNKHTTAKASPVWKTKTMAINP